MTKPAFDGWPRSGTRERFWLDRLYWRDDFDQPVAPDHYFPPQVDTGTVISHLAVFKGAFDSNHRVRGFVKAWAAWRALAGSSVAARTSRSPFRWAAEPTGQVMAADAGPDSRIVAYVHLARVREREGGGGEWRRGWR